MKGFWAVLGRDLQLALRGAGDWLNPLVFFLMVILLFPLGISPEPSLLRQIAPGVVWVAAVLAVLLSMDSLFRQDFEDGTLEQMLLAPTSTLALVWGKVLAHWMTGGLALTILSPLASVMLNLQGRALGILMLTLLLGTPVLSLLAALAAALTVALRRAGVLLPLISLPLMIPVLIFATAAVQSASMGLPVGAYLALLGVLLIISLLLVPWAIVGALRLAVTA
ncbi:MAG: heme exporter protein CcmB [Pseudomonadales bacterium]|nr:heme exporter protein CcmB [Pseudomonadales bacterium]